MATDIPRYELRLLSEHIEPAYPYVAIADLIREDIATGRFGGYQIPPITEATEFYGVARGTYARALKILREEGLVATLTGMGTFILPPQS